MNTLGKTLMAGTAATAMAVATPAQARDGDGIDAGDVIAGAIIIGGIAAIASAIDNDGDRYDRRDRRYDRNNDRRYSGYYGHRMTPRAAVEQCITAAQQRASYYGRARVTEITDVDRERRGYDIEGRIVVNEGRRGQRWNTRYDRNDRRGRYGRRNIDNGRFDCRVRDGRIDRLRVRGLD